METLQNYPSITHAGIKDSSRVETPLQRLPGSQHTPLFSIFTQMGRGGVQMIDSTEFVLRYGEKTLETTSDFYTHQSALVGAAIENQNATICINRIILPGAKPASMSIGVDETFPEDWFTGPTHIAKKEETYLPIMDVVCDNEGTWGNEYGFVISKGTEYDKLVARLEEDVEIYHFKLLKKDTLSGKMSVIPNNHGEYTTTFTFKPQSIGRGGIDYYFNSRINDMYMQDAENPERQPILGKCSFYFENFSKLVKQSPHYDPDVPVYNQDLTKLYSGSLIGFSPFKGEHHLELGGGSDGFETDKINYITRELERIEVYDNAVYEFLLSLTENNIYTDMAKYPYSTLYDSGFSYRTKLAMRTLMNTRRDVWCGVSCFTVADYVEEADGEVFKFIPPQSEQEIQAMANKLKTAFKLTPESYKFGTSALRAIIVKNSGVYDKHPYKRRQSLLLDIVEKYSRYAGAGDGYWDENFAIDNEKNKIVTGWSNLDGINITHGSRTLNTNNSLIYLETFDTKNYHFPYYRTIYGDETSVLNDFLTMTACCYLEKLGAEAWRRFGTSKLSLNKRLESISGFIQNGAKDKFHGRFDIRVRADSDALTRQSTDIVAEIYADKVKHSNLYTIEARRSSDLNNQQNN